MNRKKIVALCIFLILSAVLAAACSQNAVSVNFYVDGALYASYKVKAGESFDDVPSVPEKEGYKGAWDVTDFDSLETSVDVNAVYTPDVYTVTFVADGAVIKTVTQTKGKIISDVPSVPGKEGYDGEWNVSSFSEINADATVTAVYTLKDIYVTFYKNNYVYTVASVKAGAEVTADTYYVVSENGYALTADSKFVSGTVYYNRAREIYAKIKTENGAVTNVPEPPESEGLSVRWMKISVDENGAESFETPVFSGIKTDISMIAYEYAAVTLVDSSGASAVTSTVPFDIGKSVGDIPQIVKANAGREFFAWYYDEGFLDEVGFPCSFSANVTLYAKWISSESTEGLIFTDGTVTGYEGEKTEVYIPYRYEKDGNYISVTAVGESAFENSSVASVHIPNTVVSVGNRAFYGCVSLVSVGFDNGCYVASVGGGAFENCAALVSVEFSQKTVSIGERAFYGCSSLASITNIDVSGLTEIASYAFYGCAALEEIALPPIETIGSDAFYGCAKAEISFADADALKNIGSDAFYGCAAFDGVSAKNLETLGSGAYAYCRTVSSISVPAGDAAYSFFSGSAESGFENYYYAVTADGKTYYVPKMLYNATVNGEILVSGAFYDMYTVKNVSLNGVKEISERAFSVEHGAIDTADEFTVSFPDGLTAIDKEAFLTRNDLRAVAFPSSLTEIGEKAFYGIENLETVALPSKCSVSEIGAYAFGGTGWYDGYQGLITVGSVVIGVSQKYCSKQNYTEVKASDMGAAVTVAPHAFDGNTVIGKVALGSSVSTVGDYAFANCSALAEFAFNSNSLGSAIRKIGEKILDGCGVLSVLTVYEDIKPTGLFTAAPSSLKNLNIGFAGKNVTVSKDTYVLSGIETVNIGDGFTAVEEEAFFGCASLKTVVFGKDVESIGKDAFKNDSALSVCDASASVKLVSVGESAFEATALTSLSLPSSVVSIGKRAFFGTRLSSFVSPEALTEIGESAFGHCGYLSAATIGNSVKTVGNYAFESCALHALSIPEGVAVGAGALYGNAPFASLSLSGGLSVVSLFTFAESGTEIVSVPVNFNTATVRSGAIIDREFYGITNLQIVTINKGVTSIGESAFEDCAVLSKIVIPSSVEFIGKAAFKNCDSLTSCQIDSSDSVLVSVGDEAFSGCEKLTYAVFPDTVEEGAWVAVFDGCASLSATNLPEKITSIGDYAYRNCASLVTVGMGDGVISIGNGAFYGCAEIDFDDVSFDKLGYIGESAFYGCKNLHGIKAVAAVSIGADAYEGCDGISEITVFDRAAGYYTDKASSLTAVNAVGDVPSDVFADCGALETAVFYGASENTVKAVIDYYGDKTLPLIFVNAEIYDGFSDGDVYKAKINRNPSAANFTYSYSGTYAEITGVTESGAVLYLPESVTAADGTKYSVKSVGAGAFKNNGAIKTVIVPSGITAIGESAFYGSAVESVRFESGSLLSSVGNSAFYNCGNLSAVVFPSNTVTIGAYAFYGCASLSSVKFYANSKLSYIGDYAFMNCSDLPSVVLTGAVAYFGAHAFDTCGSLASFDFGTETTFTAIGGYAFNGDDSLTSVNIPEQVEIIGENAFYGYQGESLILSDKITSIGKCAFKNSSRLSSATFGKNIEDIGESAFENCTALVSAAISDSVVSIGARAFYGCTGLKSLIIGKSAAFIGNAAFYGTKNLASIEYNAVDAADLTVNNSVFYQAGYNTTGVAVKIASSVTYIPAYLFCPDSSAANAPKTASVTFCETPNVKGIGAFAFAYCRNLAAIVIPVTVLYAGENVFYGCANLSVSVENAVSPARFSAGWNGAATVSYGYNNRIYGDYSYVLHGGKAYLSRYNGSETDVTVPSSLNGYETVRVCAAFENNTAVRTVTIPSCAGVGSFYGCVSLVSVEIQGAPAEIAEYAFYGCSSLLSFTVKSSVEKIGKNAFYGCVSLGTVFIDSSAESLTDAANGGVCGYAETVYIKSGITVSDSAFTTDYRLLSSETDGYSVYTKLYWNAAAEGNSVYVYLLGENYAEGTYNLFVSGAGDMKDYASASSAEWYKYSDDIVSVTIGEDVRLLGQYAFYGLTSLEQINFDSAAAEDYSEDKFIFAESGAAEGYVLKIGGKVSVIPSYLFSQCARLVSVDVSEAASLVSIGESAFYNCSGLTEATLPDSLVSVGANAFAECGGLISVTVGKALETFGEKAFYSLKYLAEINYNAVNADDLSGDLNVFTSVYSVQEGRDGAVLSIGAGVKRVPSYLFDNCVNIASLTFAENSILSSVGAYAFYKCSGLTELTVPSSVTAIEAQAFAQSSVASLSFGRAAALDEIGENAFFATAYYNDENNWTAGALYAGVYLLRALPDSIAEDYSVTQGTTVIASGAFSGCSSLSFAHIPSSVTDICAGAFGQCPELKTVYVSSKYVAGSLDEASSQGGLCAGALHVYVLASLITGIKITVGEYVTDSYTCAETDTQINGAVYYTYTKAYWTANASGSVRVYLVNDTEIKDKYEIKVQGTGEMLDFDTADSVYWREYEDRISGIYVAQTVTHIGDYSFANCIYATSADFDGSPAALSSIGINAFNGCVSLTSVTIPENVTSIKARAFYNCKNLSRVDYRAAACSNLSVDANAFTGAGADTNGISVEIQNNVTRLPAYLFYSQGNTENSPKIAWVTFKSVGNVNLCAEVGDYAFAYCANLVTLTFAAGEYLKTIGAHAFENCSSLASVSVTAGVTAVGASAFYDCYMLSEIKFNAVEFTETVKGNKSFENAGRDAADGITLSVSLKTKIIPAHIMEGAAYLKTISYAADCVCATIGEGAFEDCTGLVAVTVPNVVTTVGAGAFSGCVNLVRYTAPFIGGHAAETDASVFTSFGYVFGTALKTGCSPTSQSYGTGSSVYYVPESITAVDITLYTNIYYGAFQNCGKIRSVKMYSNTGVQNVVKSSVSVINGYLIGNCAFENCASLVSFTPTEQTGEIGSSAFENCVVLDGITIPRYVVSIGASAYADCTGITSINFEAAECADLTVGVFASAGKEKGGITVNFGAYVKRVPAYAFYSDTYPSNLSEAIFGGTSCGTVGKYAFANNANLNIVSIPSSTLSSVGEQAFYSTGYYNAAANWMNGLLYVGDCLAKANAAAQASSTVKTGTYIIADRAFENMTSVTSVGIADSVKYIGNYAFYGCSKLEEVRTGVSNALVSIGSYAFGNCTKLGSATDDSGNIAGFTVSANVTKIGDFAFDGCAALTVVRIRSAAVSAGITADSGTVFGYIVNHAATVCVLTDIAKIGSYITNNYIENGTADGYKIYIKNNNN